MAEKKDKLARALHSSTGPHGHRDRACQGRGSLWYPVSTKCSLFAFEIPSTYLDSLRGSRGTDQYRDGLRAARIACIDAAAARVHTRGLASVEFIGWTDGTVGVS